MVWEKFMVFPLSDEFRLSNRIRPFCEGKLFPEEMRRRLRHPLYPVCIFREDLTMRSETLRSLDGVHLAFLAHGDDAKLFANLPDLYPMTITRWSTGWVMPHCPHCGEYVDYLERYNPLTGIATCENSQCRQSTTQLESWRRFFRTEEVSKASLLCVIDQDACEEMYEFYKAIKKKEVCKLTQWTVMMAHSMPKKATILEQRGIAHLV